MQKTIQDRTFFSKVLFSSLLCVFPLSAAALTDPSNPATPVIDTIAPEFVNGPDFPEPFVGIVSPISFNAELPIVKPDLSGIDKIVISDQAETTDETPVNTTFTPSGEIGPLAPGQHTITWTATDLGLNQASVTQTINVLPSVNLDLNQIVGEGSIATVTAHLSGKAPSYPVNVAYSVVADTADSADYEASDGEFVFTENQTSASISISIIDDGLADSDESFDINLGALPETQVFAGQQTSHKITITETNLTPHAHLLAKQDNKVTRIISNDAGKVTICAMPDCGEAHDANDDIIKYDWSATDNALVPTTGTTNNTFEFETQELNPGFYTIRLTVSDAAGKASSHDLLLRLLETEIELTDTDSDDDKINDDIEGYFDDDNDGIPNYLDAIANNTSLMQAYEPYLFDQNLKTEDSYSIDSIKLSWELSSSASNLTVYPLLIATSPGLHINIGPTAFAAAKTYARLETSRAVSLRGASLPDNNIVSSDGQVVDIEISNLAQTDGTALIVLPQAAPTPNSKNNLEPRFILFSKDKTWRNFDSDEHNEILTANKTNSYCPDLSNTASYKNKLTKGDECLLIKIQDGGNNDYDGVANGSIRLMGGVFITTDSFADESQAGGIFTGNTDSTQEGSNKLDLGTGNGGGSLGFISLFGLLLTTLRHTLKKSINPHTAKTLPDTTIKPVKTRGEPQR